MNIIAEIILMIAALAGLIMGVQKYFKPHKAIFPQLITCALGSLFVGQLFVVLRTLLGFTYEFHIGMLAPIGMYMFFLSANYAQMDSLLDNDNPQYKKYSYTALIPMILILAMIVPLWMSGANLAVKIVGIAQLAVCAAASFFNLKHAIFPDVENGILADIRGYNWVALIIEITGTLALLFMVYRMDMLMDLCLIVEAAASAAVIPVFAKGAGGWYK